MGLVRRVFIAGSVSQVSRRQIQIKAKLKQIACDGL